MKQIYKKMETLHQNNMSALHIYRPPLKKEREAVFTPKGGAEFKK